MRYVNERYNVFQHFMEPLPFRRSPVRRLRPVPGGRWMIRKVIPESVPSQNRTWRAWSNGKARPYAQYFETQAEAVAWAQDIATTFKVGDPDTRAALRQELAERRRNEREHRSAQETQA